MTASTPYRTPRPRAPDVCGEAVVRKVSVVVPILNEEPFIAPFLDDLSRQDYEGEIELVAADGCSRDRSAAVLERLARRHGIDATVLSNPCRYVSSGLNRCIGRSTGDLIVRMDCHARYPRDYVRRCARAAEKTGAENVGGLVVPVGRTAGERATACAMSSPFGGIGWTRHCRSAERVEVDTVTYGAFRPGAFVLAGGGFDETLVRDQDDELNLRLRLGGGRIVLDPSIRVEYVPRRTVRAVLRQYYEYGFWKVAVMAKHRRILGARSLAPVCLLVSLGGLTLASPFSLRARRTLAAETLCYATAAAGFAFAAVRRRHEPSGLAPAVIARFAAFHVGYGIGMLRGVTRLRALRGGDD